MNERTPNGWVSRELGSFCKVASGGTPSRTRPEFFEGDIPWVKIGDMTHWIVTDTEERISKNALENSAAKIFPKNTVLISIFATIGSVAVLGIEAATNQAIAGVIPDSRVASHRFLAYYLLHIRPRLEHISRGVAQRNINQRILKSTKILLPPLHIQERIGEVLDRARNLQGKREDASQLTEGIIQSVFFKMFGDPATNPRRWPSHRLLELAELRGGIQLSKERRPKNFPRPYLTIRNVYAGRLDLSDVRYIEVPDEQLERWILKPGDLLVLEGGDRDDVGRTAMFRGELENCVHQNHVFRVRVKTDVLAPEYLMHYLNSDHVKSQFFMLAKATTGINSINMTQLKSVGVLCPPMTIQKDFARFVERVDLLKNRQIQSTTEINELFHSLMCKSFRGEIGSTRGA